MKSIQYLREQNESLTRKITDDMELLLRQICLEV